MNRAVTLGVALVCMVAGAVSARASDLPARSAPPPASPTPWQAPFSWSGFYAGINGGYAWGQSRWSDPAAGANSGRFDTSGGSAGGQLGYNWQTGRFVFGVETDAGWLGVNGSVGPGGVCSGDGGGQCRTEQSWLGTTRARVGYAFDRWLPYVTGGVGYGDIRAVQPTGTTSDVKAGWAAGGGVEYGINRNWSAKLEYLHVDLGTATFMGAGSKTSTLGVPVTDDLVRAGINYHW